MSSSDESFEQMDASSSSDYNPKKSTNKSMNLRANVKKSYRELEHSDLEDSDSDLKSKNKAASKNRLAMNSGISDEMEIEQKNDDSTTVYDEPGGVFYPDIDIILWKKEKISEDGIKSLLYLVKYKDYSYLHLEWLEESEIVGSKSGKNKINRFHKTFEKKLMEQEIDLDDDRYFDPTYVEVDKVIYTTELFPIIHPKKSNELKGKWSELLVTVVSKLLNFTKDKVNYGVYFMEPVNPDKDGIPNYKKLVQNPMDLGTIMNRLYLDFYKNAQQFWIDLGLVFKNCRLVFRDPDCDIRILCDTLREVAIELYKQWHKLSKEKYDYYCIELRQKAKEDGSSKLMEEKPDDQTIKIKQKIEHTTLLMSLFEREHLSTADFTATAILSDLQYKMLLLNYLKSGFYPDEIAILSDPSVTIPTFLSTLSPAIKEQIHANLKNSFCLLNMHLANEEQKKGLELKNIDNNENNKIEKNQTLSNSNTLQNNQETVLDLEKKPKFEPLSSFKEIELINPGELSFIWVKDDKSTTIGLEAYEFIGDQELKEIDINKEVDKLYMVKWKNLSYLEATWEHESILSCPNKINDFKNFNRSLDKEGRQQMLQKVQRHKALIDLMNNPKKKAKMSHAALQDIKNKLYHYDVLSQKQPLKYNINTQPIYKERKLLRDYQLESLNWLIQAWFNKRNVILADEMGLGKTIQSISFLNHLINFENCRGPFLIIAPLSTLEHWKRTIEDWTTLNGVLYYDVNGIEGRQCCRGYEWFYTDISTKGNVLQSAELYKFHILVTSNEVFLQDLNNVLINIPFQFIVVDEAHRLKNQNAKILTALKRLPCKRILLLTGTPIQNNTEELWSLLNYIEPDRFQRLEDFKEKFGDLNNAEQIENLHTILKPFLLRRMKEDVEASIPPLQETIIDVELTTTQKTIYKALYEKNKTILSRGFSGGNFTTSLNNLEMQLRKCCNHPYLIHDIEYEFNKNITNPEEKINKLIECSGKMILLDKLLPKIKSENKKVLIFSQFTYMLVLVEDYLKYKGYRFEKIDGTIKAKERQNAIDRFSNPEKKRDVFLLSTKAGGLGINLTSANVVIIFDSDWNPQNDVQATARAHRIGQINEVQVYRLITAKTYEAEMFERATKKLGLDQAIFMGGAFQSTGIDMKKDDGIRGGNYDSLDNKKMSKQEIEILLKKGILGLIEENANASESQPFVDDDIDEILKKNSRIAKYSLINGSYTFSKSSFVSKQTDATINMDDPNFWERVLKSAENHSKKLLNEIEKSPNQFENYEKQKEFMLKISEIVNQLIESKLNIVGYNADEETNIQEILNRILSLKNFHKNYKELATQWLYEIARPTRRFKKLNLLDLDITGAKKAKGEKENGEEKKEEEDGDQIFNEEAEEGGEDDFLGEEGEEPEGKKKLTQKDLEDRLKRLCSFCERPKCTNFCEGFCHRAFHESCRQKYESDSKSKDDLHNSEINEFKMDSDRLIKLMKNFTCKNCESKTSECFKCKKKGNFIILETARERKKHVDNGSELIKCSTLNCHRFYHVNCISHTKLIKFLDGNKTRFRCPLHFCVKCVSTNDTLSMVQCFRCPTGYHVKCLPKEKVFKLSKKYMICQHHELPLRPEKLSSDEPKLPIKKKNSQSRLASKPSKESLTSSTLVKLPKLDQIEEDNISNVSQTNYKIKKKVEKMKSKEAEKNNKIKIIVENNGNIKEKDKKSKISEKNDRNKRKRHSSSAKKTKGNEEFKYSYEELGIPSAEDFDYDNYQRDWCRYCGSRYSSNFTKGPWGPRTLCTIHYIDWNQKKTLNLNPYYERPKKPIDLKFNTELSFLTKKIKANPDYSPKTEFEDFMRKKIKSEEPKKESI